jgi:hypothetical protein
MMNYDKPERLTLIHDIGVNTIGAFAMLVNRLTNYLAEPIVSQSEGYWNGDQGESRGSKNASI